MKESVSPLRYFLSSLPGWFALFKTLEFAFLRSQEPKWFALYSTKKLLVILAGFSFFFIWLKWISPRIALLSFWNDASKFTRLLRPIPTFICLALFVRLCSLGMPSGAGEDTTPQALSTLQWMEGLVPAPNFLSTPNISDLSQDSIQWLLRPPAAAYLPLPGLFCGLSLGTSLHLTLFALFVAGGVGWLHLATRFGLSHNLLLLATLLLAGPAGTTNLSLTTASCITAALFPWALLWVGRLGKRLSDPTPPLRHSILGVASFYLLLGCLAWVKLSSLLTIAAAAVALPAYSLLKSKKSQFIKLSLLVASCGPLFLLPYMALERTNSTLSNLDADTMYSRQNYDTQSDLWGEHFTASTRGPMLALSLTAAPGYALPPKKLIHGLRDLIIQFEGVQSFLRSSKLNHHVFLSGLAATGLSLCLFLFLKRLPHETASPFETSVCTVLASVPFLGLAFASFMHGFNYVLFHAYTGEFSFIFILLCLRFLAHSAQTNALRTARTILLPLCLAQPLQLSAEQSIASALSTRTNVESSETERQRNLGAHRFSTAIRLAEDDSHNPLDLLLFLPSGDMGDLRLRTSLRSFALHFSGNNISNYAPFVSSKPLNVYCLIDNDLWKDPHFRTILKTKFPMDSSWRELSPVSSASSPSLMRVEISASSL